MVAETDGTSEKSHPKFTTDQVIAALRESRGMVAVAARKLGCSRLTLYRYIKRHAAVREAIEDERALMTDTAELSLYRSITSGEAWAVCFYLKTQGKSRGYVERTETVQTGEMIVRLVYEDRDPRAVIPTVSRPAPGDSGGDPL